MDEKGNCSLYTQILVFLLIGFSVFLSTVSKTYASSVNKYVVIVSPVREKVLWRDIESIERQIKIVKENGVSSTWLLQYSVVKDRETQKIFQNMDSNNEIGVLLEVNSELANDSRASYLRGEGDWARADKVLLSGYNLEERKRMIDKLFDEFKKIFGKYPKAVGAWYIDTDSLNYLANKYRIKSVVEVADQYQTDSYGVWGKPWGSPYFPSKYNTFLPAKSGEDQLDVVTIQWAARDPVLGYGLTVSDSTYSVQANDYIGLGLDINYFEKLVRSYLNSANELSQLTIGLEVGQEGAVYWEELDAQIKKIKEIIPESVFLTMSDFASIFKKVNPSQNPNFIIVGRDPYQKDKVAYWFSSPYFRVSFLQEEGRFYLRDLRLYEGVPIFYDIFKKDKKENLFREIPACVDSLISKNQKLIAEDLEKVTFERKGDVVEFILRDKKGSVKKLILTSNNFFIDGVGQLRWSEKIDFKEVTVKNLVGYLFDFGVNSSHSFKGGIRYSELSGQSYLGFVVDDEILFGITSKFPYFGTFHFPFQTLIYFKPIPKVNFARLVLESVQ